jgi:hypothetical protein
MKLRYALTVSLFTVFMIPFIKNINTADALDKYGCDNPDRQMHINCLRTKLDITPYGLTVPKGNDGLGNYQCGKKQENTTNRQHINCLMLLLDQHGANLAAGRPGGNSGDPCMKTKNPVACMIERAKKVGQQKSLPGGDSGDPCMKKQDPMTCMIERAKAAASR